MKHDDKNSEDSAPGDADLLGFTPVETPEISNLVNAVRRAIRLGFGGMAVYGKQRCGKSSAAEFLEKNMSLALGYPCATVLWSIPEFCKTERDFIQERLIDSKCPAIAHRDIAMLRNRLYDHIQDLAAKEGTRTAVIIVDEAQNLTLEQFYYLVHCDNSLRKRGLKTFIMPVGQPELESISTTWRKAAGHQVTGRFFSREHWYQGIALEDIGVVCSNFDEPEGESTEATYASALPEAYDAGWRISHAAPTLVKAIEQIAAKQNINSGVRVPMLRLRAMILAMLWSFIETGTDPKTFDINMAIAAVIESGFPSVIEFYVDGGS
jgi:hypothetical protein